MDWKEMSKMTVVKLREEAMQHGIEGVHGKTKAQIMDEMADKLGIEKPHAHFSDRVMHTKGDLKHRIKELKAQRDKHIEAHDHKALHQVRREIHGLKRRIRKIELKAARKAAAATG